MQWLRNCFHFISCCLIRGQEFLSMTSRKITMGERGSEHLPRSQSLSPIPAHCPRQWAASVSIFKTRSSPHTSQDLSGGQDEMMHVKPMASGQAKDSPINTPQILKTHSNQDSHQNLIGKHRVSQFTSRIEIDFMKHLIVFFPISQHFTAASEDQHVQPDKFSNTH